MVTASQLNRSHQKKYIKKHYQLQIIMDSLKDLDLTRDEVDRLTSALKDKEFRKLFAEYVDELHDPENKRIFQKEVVELEKERGMDCTFLNPEPGYVIKTSVDGSKKAFINVCSNENIEKPTSTPSYEGGTKGLSWAIPHSLTPPRDDIDNKRVRCRVFDVIFHPDTFRIAKNNKAFWTMVNNTACDSVESNFGVALDRKNLKFPKLQYKGAASSSVIRKPSEHKPSEKSPEEQEVLDKIFNQIPKQEPHKKPPCKPKTETNKTKYTTPKYIIKHRSHIDLENYTFERDSKMNMATPKELIVEINLPMLKAATDMDLDVAEKSVQLVSEKPAKYKLSITLPYKVNHDNGNAKFDKDSKILTIILPVIQTTNKLDFTIEDSCVESDKVYSLPSSPPNENSRKIEELPNVFLNPQIHYSLPEFTCHQLENKLYFTLHVKNVNENSIEKICNPCDVHLKLTSISSGYYPVHYAFYVKLQSTLDTEEVIVEVWDNNVVLQLSLDDAMNVSTYLVGLDKSELYMKNVDKQIEPSMEEDDLDTTLTENTMEEVESKIEDLTVKETTQKANKVVDVVPLREEPSKAIDIVRLHGESSGDDTSCSSYSPKSKGILKRRTSSYRSSVSRSISESSIDDAIWASSYENCYNSMESVIAEDTDVSSSLKKTVTFNDHVKRQLYRSNSSILGQKRKNQKKAKSKKRAQERRHSESEVVGESNTICEEDPSKRDDAHIFECDL